MYVCVCGCGTVAAGQAVVPGLQVTLLLRLATFVNEFVCLLHISSCRFSSHCSLYCFAVRIVPNDVATVAVGVDAGVGAAVAAAAALV